MAEGVGVAGLGAAAEGWIRFLGTNEERISFRLCGHVTLPVFICDAPFTPCPSPIAHYICSLF